MSLLSTHGKSAGPLQMAVSAIRSRLTEVGSDYSSQQLTKSVTSMESLSDSDRESFLQTANDLREELRSTFESLNEQHGSKGLGFEDFLPHQMEAGQIAALASGDPVAYAEAAMLKQAPSENGVTVISYENSGSAGSLDYRDEPAMESFDQRPLHDYIPYSIAFNIQASRQDEFGEAFFPTTIVSPDHGGLDMEVDHITVYNAVKHRASGQMADFGQRNLVEAVSDASILADESTTLIPHYLDSGENADKFVDTSVVATYYRKISDVEIQTAPLKAGVGVDLLGISQHPELLGAGVIDHTDAIDTRLALQKVYMQLASDGSVVDFNVLRLPRSGFIKSVEGENREMALNFRTEDLVLKPGTLAADGSAPPELQTVRDNNYTVRLRATVTGHAHLATGNVNVAAIGIEVAGISTEDGDVVPMTAGAGKSIAGALSGIQMIGYELLAARTNSNRRSRGLLINRKRYVERYAIPLGAPISAPSPNGSGRDTRDLDSLITAGRIRNSNNAVTSLLNYADTLRAYVTHRRHGQGHPAIEGMGRFMVVPFFEEMDLDVSTVINSLNSASRAEDIAAVFVNAIKDLSYRMYRYSGYQAALNASSFGDRKPRLVVGTDSVIARHLMVLGDTRTFGIQFENFEIVTSFDSRMDNKIVMSFVRSGAEGQPDPLSFGTHAWMPQLASSMQVTRDGANYQEAMVQPRTRHINNLPIMAVINVTGLKDVLTTNIAVTTDEVGTTSGSGDSTSGSTTTTSP